MNIAFVVYLLSCALGYQHQVQHAVINFHPQCNIKFSILINSTFFVNLLSYALEYRNNIVS